MIKVHNLYKKIGEDNFILTDISLHIYQGEFVSIMGASGSGKSTLLGILAGIDSPSEGNVFINGTEITKMSETRLCKYRNETIGIILQSPNLIDTLTALENIQVPILFSKKDKDMAKAKEMLSVVGLEAKAKCYPKQLSGGEAQRISIARTLACSPQVIFADEPTGALDSQNGKMVIDILKEIVQKQNVTVVMVTHDENLARQTDRIVYLKDGRICNE